MFSSLKSGSFVPLDVKDLDVVRLALGRVDQLAPGRRQSLLSVVESREQLIADIQKQLDRLTKLVERIGLTQKQEAKWRMVFRRQLNALVRRAALADAGLPHPMAIGAQRFRLRSQHEEDGITLALLRAAGVSTGRSSRSALAAPAATRPSSPTSLDGAA